MCPDAPRQVSKPPKESALEPQPANFQGHRGSPCGDFRESVSSRKQTCIWMPSHDPAAQEDTRPLAKEGPQPTPAKPHLGMLQLCTKPPRPPSARAPSQPLRMVFTRLDRSCWSSRFLAAPSFVPPEKPGPAHGPPTAHVGQSLCLWPLECPPR